LSSYWAIETGVICADPGRRVLAGEMTGPQAGTAAATRSRAWREANAANVDQYRRRATDAAAQL